VKRNGGLVSRRRVVPLGLTCLLGVAVLASAALSVTKSSSNLSSKAQSKQFHADVRRTLASKSFTVHALGQVLDYQAPDRTRVVLFSAGAFGGGFSYVTIGSDVYSHFGLGQWEKLPNSFAVTGGLSQALGYLRALSAFKTATLDGDVYTVHGVISEVPKAIATLVFTTVTKGPHNQVGTAFDPNSNEGYATVIGHAMVHNGLVTSETFTTLRAHPTRGRDRGSRSGTVTYSALDSSPTIGAPTKADLTPPCHPGSSGSCQVTSKGSAPNSPLCKVVRSVARSSLGKEQTTQLPATAKSGKWSETKTALLSLLTDTDMLSKAVERSPKGTPKHVLAAAQEEVENFHKVKAVLLGSRSGSQFESASTSSASTYFGSSEVLAKYLGTQCGGTTSYSSSTEGSSSSFSSIAAGSSSSG
jgi:hypothetical protein